MFAEWRHAYANIALTGGNLSFLLIAAKFPTAGGISTAASLVGITSFYAWYANLRRFRTITDTPTSRIASAPQGYIELTGKGVHPPGEQLISPVSGLPCLWFRYLVEEKYGDKWRRIESGVSSAIFGLQDCTGLTLIDPDDAEVLTSNKQVTLKGRYRHTEWTLIEGERLYVLGEHITQSGATADLNASRDVSELLAEWKQDQAGLLKRFDLDGDGNISLDEWESARMAAKRQIERAHQELRLQRGTSMIGKSKGRVFLIANRTPEQMASRYSLWARVHLSLLLAACLTIVMLR